MKTKKKGEMAVKLSRSIRVLKCHYKRNVFIIFTHHSSEMQTDHKRGKDKQKPICAMDYNEHMMGDVLRDHLLQTCLVDECNLFSFSEFSTNNLILYNFLNKLSTKNHCTFSLLCRNFSEVFF